MKTTTSEPQSTTAMKTMQHIRTVRPKQRHASAVGVGTKVNFQKKLFIFATCKKKTKSCKPMCYNTIPQTLNTKNGSKQNQSRPKQK